MDTQLETYLVYSIKENDILALLEGDIQVLEDELDSEKRAESSVQKPVTATLSEHTSEDDKNDKKSIEQGYLGGATVEHLYDIELSKPVDPYPFIEHDSVDADHTCKAEICYCNESAKNTVDFFENKIKNVQNKMNAIQTELWNSKKHRESMGKDPKSICKCNPVMSNPGFDMPSPAKELRQFKEQYKQMKDDYSKKVEEISRLTCETRRQRDVIRKAEHERKVIEDQYITAQEKLKEIEKRSKEFLNFKDQIKDMELELRQSKMLQQLTNENINRTNKTLNDRNKEVDELRKKYLEEKQKTEDQKHIVKRLEMDSEILRDDINMQISHIKTQYQQKLDLLRPLPQILEKTRDNLKEAMERKTEVEMLYNDAILRLTDSENKIQVLVTKLNEYLKSQTHGKTDSSRGVTTGDDVRSENKALRVNLANLQYELSTKIQELLNAEQRVSLLAADLENSGKESARQIAAAKEQEEQAKRLMQEKVMEAEAEVALAKSEVQAAQFERERVRHRLQSQINFLNDSLSIAQHKIKELEGYINKDQRESYQNNMRKTTNL